MKAQTGEQLAVHGGQPVRVKPWQDNFTIGEEEKQAVLSALDTGYLSLFEGSHTPDLPFSFWGGPRVQQLERDWASAYGARFAVSVNSATSGLMAAIGALNLGFGDEIIVSPYTMSACASSALIYGAIPVFADVDRATGSLDPAGIRAALTPRTRAVLVVHQFGIPADMDAIMAIARSHDLKVIEDCAQAHGAKYRGRPVGTIGDVGVFSLNVNKTIQTGEGGVCLTNDEDVRYRLALIRNHGEAVVEAAGYQSIENIIGFNLRMTEVTAAMAIEQLKKLPALNKTRLALVAALSHELARHSFLDVPPACCHGAQAGSCGCLSTYYVYPLRFHAERLGVSRTAFVDALRGEGIPMAAGYVRPLYLQPIYQSKRAFKQGYPFSAPANAECRPNYARGACPAAETLHYEEMLINEHVRPPHTLDDVLDIAKAIDKVELAVRAGRLPGAAS
jgi:perosamine synthetase